MKKVAVSNFVKRQTPESEFSYFDGDWQELEDMVKKAMSISTKPGYRDGVVLVEVNPHRFYTSVVDLVDGDILSGEFKPRQEGEEPRIHLWVVSDGLHGGKQKAVGVDIVLYRHDVLAEGNENSADAEWEIISIKARPSKEEQPIEPNVLMHNHFLSSGGTKTNMTNDEFVAMLEKSFNYWKNKAKAKPTI